MKILSNAELRILYQRRDFLREFVQTVLLQLTANITDSWKTLLERINTIRQEVKEIVEDSQFDVLVSKAVISHPSPHMYSPPNTMINIIATAKELTSYIDSVLKLHLTPKTKELEEEPQKKGKVFSGHGKNVIVRGKVKDFIKEGCDLDPMILEELPSEGMTVIEKLEKYGRTADYAILILTADDLIKDKVAPRARQNVIQELGWFQGVIGRNRTAILKQEGVEIASNIAGVVYFGFKDNEVEIIFESLRKELKKAGLL